MPDVERKKKDLLEQIELLLAESYRLPHKRTSWERRTEIDWEIILLCRRLAELNTGAPPYWAGHVVPVSAAPASAAAVPLPGFPAS